MIPRIFGIITILFFIFYLSINQFTSYTQINSHKKSDINSVRIFCLILTTPKYFDTRARAVNLTWAPRCDKYFFISEYSNNTNNLPIAPIENLTAGYKHLTQKTTLAFYYAYENLFDQFDWFVKADDDTYMIIENLKIFLQEQNSSQPVTFGYNFKSLVSNGFHSGGAAYVLSREALKRFYEAHHEKNSTCLKDGGRGEDVEIADCLRKKNVYPGKSVDKYNRERFHPLPFSKHYLGKLPSWLITYAENKPSTGIGCCSDTTISFHYVTPKEQYLIDKMRYGFHREN